METAVQGLTTVINEKLAEVQRVYMLDANSGDETPDQAVQWDYHVDALARLIVEVKAQNQ